MRGFGHYLVKLGSKHSDDIGILTNGDASMHYAKSKGAIGKGERPSTEGGVMLHEAVCIILIRRVELVLALVEANVDLAQVMLQVSCTRREGTIMGES